MALRRLTSYYFTLVSDVGLELVLVRGNFSHWTPKSSGIFLRSLLCPTHPTPASKKQGEGNLVQRLTRARRPSSPGYSPFTCLPTSAFHSFSWEVFDDLGNVWKSAWTFHNSSDVNNPTQLCCSYCSATQKVCLVFTKSLPKIFNQMGLSPSLEPSCKLIQVKEYVKY